MLIFSITFILSFFVNFVFPLGSFPVPVVVIFMIISYLSILLFYSKSFKQYITLIIQNKNNYVLPLLIFTLFISLSIPFYFLAGNFSIIKFLIQFVGIFIFQSVLIFLLFGFISYKIFSEKYLYKLTIISLFIVLLIGILDFISAYLQINSILDIINFLSNHRFYALAEYGDRVYIGSIPRIQGIFIEPAVFGIFLVTFLPFAYALFNSKFKLSKNKCLNICIKKSLLPCLWFNLIFIQSPIFLIIGLIITIFYFKENIIFAIKNYLGYIIMSVLILIPTIMLVCNKIDISETFLNRIALVISVLKDFDKFIFVEPSLATRVVNYINSLCVWQKYPLFGVGIGNLVTYQAAQMYHSPVPLTQEIIVHLQLKKFVFNSGVFYKLMSETGIIGTFVYFYFLTKLYNFMKKLFEKSKFHNISVFYKCLWGIVWVYIILCFYNMYLYYAYFYVFFGIIAGLQLKIYTKNRNITKKRV